MDHTTAPEALVAEYQETNSNVRMLADIRFKLLALLPTLGSAAIVLLSNYGLRYGETKHPSTAYLLGIAAIGLFGFAATLGVTLYDQRNSELYNALIHRAKFLEERLKLPTTPGALQQRDPGGQFRERPGRHRRLILKAGHDLALALIYGPVLGAWLFPISYSIARALGAPSPVALLLGVICGGLAAVTCYVWLVILDKRDLASYRAAARTADREALTNINIKIGEFETAGLRDSLEAIVAQCRTAEGPRPVLGFRRKTGECVDAASFLGAVQVSSFRKTTINSVTFYDPDRALVECTVEMDGTRTHNLRLFVRPSDSNEWKLLGWANGAI